jgi:hypothetical protein
LLDRHHHEQGGHVLRLHQVLLGDHLREHHKIE